MAGSLTFRVTGQNLSGATENVSDKFFGGNFLFDRDRVGEEGTFDEKAAALDIDFLRYPGGTITEQSFSMRFPNRTFDAETGRDLLPLNDFIAHAQDVGADYALVVPTINYMLAYGDGDMSLSSIRAEIRAFVTRLADGEFGKKLPTVIEIGNEFYAVEGMTETELAKLYAAVSKVFAQEIRDVLGADVEIGVQTGRFPASNDIIQSTFSGAAGDRLVDKAIFHSYPWTFDKVEDYEQSKMEIAQSWLKAGIAEGVFVSEFNLSNQYRGANGDILDHNSIEMGMSKAVALVDMAIGLIGAGVDYAAVWPLQQNTNGDLAGDEGQTGESHGDKLDLEGLTLSGAAYKLLSSSVVGKKLVKSQDFDLDRGREADRYETEVMVHSFDSADETVIFISSWDLKKGQIGTALNLNMPGRYGAAEVVRLYTDGDPLDRDARPVVTEETRQIRNLSDLDLTVDHSYEIIRVTLTKIGVSARGDKSAEMIRGGHLNDILNGAGGDDTVRGADGVDTLKGAAQDDSLFGQRGDDLLLGQRGNDLAKGGSGDDRLVGAQGNDKLIGGSGDDAVNGGTGDDILKGGSGDDVLRGHSGDDVLNGNSGDDTILGGRAEDLLRGGSGDDVLDGGGQSDRLFGDRGSDRMSGGAGGDTLNGGAGADRMDGGGGSDLILGGRGNDTMIGGAGRDEMIGGAGDDRLTSFAGNDLLTGGAGTDTFHFAFGAAGRTATVTDFAAGQDRIVVEGAGLTADDVTIQAAGADTIVYFGQTKVVLEGARGVDLGDVALIERGAINEAADVTLARGQSSSTPLGHKFAGATAPDGTATVAFDSDGRAVTLNFRAFDIDVRGEVDVLLNGKSIGELALTGNEKFDDQSIVIAARDQIAGENVITFVETQASVNTWGIDELALA